MFKKFNKILSSLLLISIFFFPMNSYSQMGGILHPAGIISHYEYNLLIISVLTMLTIIIPVIFLTIFVAWRYRRKSSNNITRYNKNFTHSTFLEIIWWTIPCIIILILSIISIISTYKLDPYNKNLSIVDDKKEILEVQVVALSWKWLFIYPKYNIATINYLPIPINTQVNFKITAAGVPISGFFIPQLGSQIYSSAGMITQLNLYATKKGCFTGICSNYNGAGCSQMNFNTEVMTYEDFIAWIEYAKLSNNLLDWAHFIKILMIPNTNYKKTIYYCIEDRMFNDIVSSYMYSKNSA